MKDLLNLLEKIRDKKLLGTLVLGRGRKSFELFIEEDLIYLTTRTYRGTIDLDGLVTTNVLGGKVTEEALDATALGMDLAESIIPESLSSRHLITEEEFKDLTQLHFREEIFSRFQENAHTFHFQEGHVPGTLIGQDGVTTSYPLSLDKFIEESETRLRQLAAIRQLIPSKDEVFVITEKGMARKQDASMDYGMRKILDLLDGFRNLHSIIEDGILFPIYVEQRISNALEEGWIKKTILPELQGLDPNRLTREEAKKYLPHFQNAIRYGADELKARENYAALCECLGKQNDAAVQYNFLGDTLYQMGKKALAIRAYHKGLTVKEKDPTIVEKIVRIYKENAREAIEQKNVNEAIALYRNAFQVEPRNPEIFDALLDLYVSNGKTTEIAELCDQATGISRAEKDPTFAIEIFQKVISSCRKEPLFYKRLINLFLDFGMMDKAADAMETLARQYIEAGHTNHGVDLIEKTLRLDPSRKHLKKLIKTTGRGVRQKRSKINIGRSLMARSSLVLVLVFTLYQLWSYQAFRKISQEEYKALAASDIQSQIEIYESSIEKTLRSLARDAAQYKSKFPLSIFRIKAEKLHETYLDAATRLERTRNHMKKTLVEKGRRLFVSGREKEALAELQALFTHCEESDPWRRQAATLVKQFRRYESQADTIRRQADEAMRKGHLEKAHELLERLLSEYSISNAAKNVTLPVKAVPIPLSLATRFKGRRFSFAIPPNGTETIELRVEGFEPLRATLKPRRGPYQYLFFNQLPTWTKKLGPVGGQELVIFDEQLIHVDEKGNSTALDFWNGGRNWSHETSSLISPTAPAMRVGSQYYLPLNNKQIIQFDLRSDAAPAREINVGGFIQTPLVSLPELSSLVFGTSQNQLLRIDSKHGGKVDKIYLPESPVGLARAGERSVVFIGDSGTTFGVDLVEKQTLWKRRQAGIKIAEGPIYFEEAGHAVVVLRTDASELIALDTTTGKLRWQLGAPDKERHVSFLPSQQRILISEDEQAVIELDPLNGEQRRRWPSKSMAVTFDRAIDLPLGLGTFRADGSFLLVDPETLEPRWRYQARGKRIQSAAQGDGRLVLAADDGTVWCFAYPGN